MSKMSMSIVECLIFLYFQTEPSTLVSGTPNHFVNFCLTERLELVAQDPQNIGNLLSTIHIVSVHCTFSIGTYILIHVLYIYCTRLYNGHCIYTLMMIVLCVVCTLIIFLNSILPPDNEDIKF